MAQTRDASESLGPAIFRSRCRTIGWLTQDAVSDFRVWLALLCGCSCLRGCSCPGCLVPLTESTLPAVSLPGTGMGSLVPNTTLGTQCLDSLWRLWHHKTQIRRELSCAESWVGHDSKDSGNSHILLGAGGGGDVESRERFSRNGSLSL